MDQVSIFLSYLLALQMYPEKQYGDLAGQFTNSTNFFWNDEFASLAVYLDTFTVDFKFSFIEFGYYAITAVAQKLYVPVGLK